MVMVMVMMMMTMMMMMMEEDEDEDEDEDDDEDDSDDDDDDDGGGGDDDDDEGELLKKKSHGVCWQPFFAVTLGEVHTLHISRSCNFVRNCKSNSQKLCIEPCRGQEANYSKPILDRKNTQWPQSLFAGRRRKTAKAPCPHASSFSHFFPCVQSQTSITIVFRARARPCWGPSNINQVYQHKREQYKQTHLCTAPLTENSNAAFCHLHFAPKTRSRDD